MSQKNKISHGVDTTVIWLYAILVAVGILCIFMVEYRSDANWMSSFLGGKTSYSKQFIFAGICALIATFILLTDSKLFTAFANLFYVFGVLLMLATFVLGKNINGSKSWIPLFGGFNLQPVEICKIFTALALAKFLSRQETDFRKLKSQVVAGIICLLPAVISILQHETGMALVYFSFFLVMFREGLSPVVLIIGFSFVALIASTLLVDPDTLAIILSVAAVVFLYATRRQWRRKKSILLLTILIWGAAVGIQRFAVPFIFNNVLECYQSARVYSAFGKDYDCGLNKRSAKKSDKAPRKPDDYNVRQSKIAIGSGGFWGRGFLKGTQTRGKYVPAQTTDFIFASLGEAFGFAGCFAFLALFMFLLFRLIAIAERQRSTFSRVYAYSVVSILFFHIAFNICMTLGLFPSPGITLPLISYGGSSLVSFTILIFILLRLDADRQMVLR
ncbi:MAG: rod shape-determining protein RodA [Sphingobacteriia bacterium]|nr:MAG: rod shape-determining protein RodA [Sphingobacteriia bacterium]